MCFMIDILFAQPYTVHVAAMVSEAPLASLLQSKNFVASICLQKK
jgi:hypothetical protein